MSDFKNGDTVLVEGYGEGTLYEETDEKTVRVKFPNGTSARVDRRNLKKPSGAGAFAGTRAPDASRDKAIRGPRE